MQQKKRSNFQGVSAISESFLSAKVKAIFFVVSHRLDKKDIWRMHPSLWLNTCSYLMKSQFCGDVFFFFVEHQSNSVSQRSQGSHHYSGAQENSLTTSKVFGTKRSDKGRRKRKNIADCSAAISHLFYKIIIYLIWMWESIDFIVKTMVLCIYLYNLDPIVFKNILKSKFQIYRGRLFESNIGKKNISGGEDRQIHSCC